jgi:hypothetical protein
MTTFYLKHANYTEGHINGRFTQRGELVECDADGQPLRGADEPPSCTPPSNDVP